VTSKGKRKRSKAMIILLLPALMFIFIMGWCLCWIGDQKRTDTTQRKTPKKDNVSFLPIVLEEEQEIMNE
jgi:hypothetical protein